MIDQERVMLCYVMPYHEHGHGHSYDHVFGIYTF